LGLRVLVPVLSLLLLAGIAASAYLLLQSCGLRLPFTAITLSVCPIPEDPELTGRLVAVDRDNTDLTRRISALEQELSRRQCVAVLPPVVQPAWPHTPTPPPPAKPPPRVVAAPRTPSGIDRKAFERRDITAMDGCWELDSELKTQDVVTGEITNFNRWDVCFNARGQGHERLRATNGVTCQGPVEGSFNRAGALIINEPGDVRCTNSMRIYRRRLTCTLDNAGHANCDGYQPAHNNHSSSRLRRARGSR